MFSDLRSICVVRPLSFICAATPTLDRSLQQLSRGVAQGHRTRPTRPWLPLVWPATRVAPVDNMSMHGFGCVPGVCPSHACYTHNRSPANSLFSIGLHTPATSGGRSARRRVLSLSGFVKIVIEYNASFTDRAMGCRCVASWAAAPPPRVFSRGCIDPHHHCIAPSGRSTAARGPCRCPEAVPVVAPHRALPLRRLFGP